ncbi:hypothetical protein SmJEL517_g05623 [Synchytrium microbalum]|uniref:NAD-dependent epimerase/dehydratase domain-containing protein n=1 Tax=Synchytrium microbalum TaxID=1806994 RepID=A0A507BUS2_9FUNG|nr:uncharacterized protein SmJEL517_g05623 [Synchytrium microbalum]TPX30951.1 hypothetical protein SmJEL517_g05623 [Synchytrium microbalum]
MAFEQGLVLVSGANGYLAMHCVDQLLKKGYKVRGTVRSQAKVSEVVNLFPEHKDSLEVIVVEDMVKDGAFDQAVVGCTAILHVASPVIFAKENPIDNVITPAIRGTTNVLKSAMEYGSNVKRVVVTSSFAAVRNDSYGPDYAYTENDWNVESRPEAGGMESYRASKAMAEKAAWKFMGTEKPTFKLTVINPVWIIGPSISNTVNTTTGLILEMLKGGPIQPSWMGFVDVRDVARAHIIALENPATAGQRYICCGTVKSFPEVATILSKMYPKEPVVAQNGEFPPVPRINTAKIEKEMDFSFIPFEQTLRETADQVLALEKK